MLSYDLRFANIFCLIVCNSCELVGLTENFSPGCKQNLVMEQMVATTQVGTRHLFRLQATILCHKRQMQNQRC